MRFDQIQLPCDQTELLFLERRIIQSSSLKIKYRFFKKEKDDNPGSNKTTYDYLRAQIHNHIWRDRANEIAQEYSEASRYGATALARSNARGSGAVDFDFETGQGEGEGRFSWPRNRL